MKQLYQSIKHMKTSTKHNAMSKFFSLLITVICFTAIYDVQAQGNPNVYGEHQWMAYCYNGNNFQTYRGFYETFEQDFDTRDSWNQNQSPSSASNYQGQSVNNNQHSISFKRRGFDCGIYTLHIPAVRRQAAVLVNGQQVFQVGGNGGSYSSIWTGYLGENSTVEFRLRTMTGDSYASLQFVSVPAVVTQWTGSVDANWFNAGNWSNGVPGEEHDAVIQNTGFSPVIDMDQAEVRNLTIQSGSTVSIADGARLRLTGSLNNQGLIEASAGTIEFSSNCLTQVQEFFTATELEINNLVKSGDGQLILDGNDINIISELSILSGELNTGNRITLVSNAAGTACLAPVINGAQITGEITVQRRIQASKNGWVQLASPVYGQTFENWNATLLTTGFPGSNYPNFNFNNIRMYDETFTGHMDIGLYNADHITNPIEPLHGYQFFLATGTHNVSVTGAPIVGEQDFGVTFTSSAEEFGEEFSAAHDGWNLVANPYPASIDWDATAGWDKHNLTDAIYVWDADIAQYNMYSNGVNINGGERFIASSQAFWVQANGENPILRIKEEAKTNVHCNFKSQSASDVLYLTLAGNGSSDQVALRLVDAESAQNAKHIPKFYSPESVAKLGISGNAESDWGIINIADNAAAELALQQAFPANGQYTITLEVSGSNYINCIFLEDIETNEWIDLRAGDYEFTATQAALHNRFVIHLGEPLQMASQPVSCNGLVDGEISWPAGFEWNVSFQNAEDYPEVVVTENSITGLPAGVYEMQIDANGLCAIDELYEVYIDSPAPLHVNEITQKVLCADSENGQVELQPTGGTAPYTIEWFNESTDWHLNNLVAGEYSYSLTDANGCDFQGMAEVGVQHDVMAGFQLSDEWLTVGQQFIPNNTSGSSDMFVWSKGDGTPAISGFEPQLVYDAPGVYTLSLTATKSFCADTYSQEIVVHDLTTGIEESQHQSEISVFAMNNIIAIETDFDGVRDLQVQVYSIIGQELTSQLLNGVGRGQHLLPVSHSGVLMVQILDLKNDLREVHRIFMK